jgi:hypothetical protein
MRVRVTPAHRPQILSFAPILSESDVSIGVIEYEATIPYTRFFYPAFGVI